MCIRDRPGTGSVATMEMTVHDDAYNSNVAVEFENITVTDGSGGTFLLASVDSGTVAVSPGYIEEPGSLMANSTCPLHSGWVFTFFPY